MYMSIGLVWRGRERKNNTQPRTPDWSKIGGGGGGSSQKTPKSGGEGGDKRHSQPNTPK